MDGRLHHDLTRLGPLPAGFPPHLRELDARLAEDARRTLVPLGLSERVFEASVSLLPREAQPVEVGVNRLRLVGAPTAPTTTRTRARVSITRQTWGVLAMAASVALLCCVAVWYLQKPPAERTNLARGGHVNGNGIDVEAAFRPLPRASSIEQLEAHFAPWRDTTDISSPDDLLLAGNF